MKILVYGDSLCDGLRMNWATHIESFPGKTVESMVQDEQNGLGLSFYLDEDNYNTCVIIAGHNDLAHHRPIEDVVNDLLVLHDVCHERGIKSYAIGIPQWKSFNCEYQPKCKEKGIRYIDLPEEPLDDGIHWSPESSRRIASYINERIME